MAARRRTSPTTSSTRSWRPRRHVHRTRAVATVASVASAAAVLAGCGPAPGSGGVADYGGLWPDRPTVALSFDVAADLRTATGRESIVFTPDLPVCELMFRAWPNAPNSAGAGSSLVITGAAVDGRPVTARVAAGGAPPGAPGTLIEIPLAGCHGPGSRFGPSSASGSPWVRTPTSALAARRRRAPHGSDPGSPCSPGCAAGAGPGNPRSRSPARPRPAKSSSCPRRSRLPPSTACWAPEPTPASSARTTARSRTGSPRPRCATSRWPSAGSK